MSNIGSEQDYQTRVKGKERVKGATMTILLDKTALRRYIEKYVACAELTPEESADFENVADVLDRDVCNYRTCQTPLLRPRTRGNALDGCFVCRQLFNLGGPPETVVCPCVVFGPARVAQRLATAGIIVSRRLKYHDTLIRG